MTTNKRTNLIAPCGIDCGICEVYTCRDNQQLYDYFIAQGFPKEKLPCDGCRNIAGLCPVINGECATYKCINEKNKEFCFECDSFPCEKLTPTADRADVLPHNTKVYNLCMIKRIGKEEFTNKSLEIKAKYYKGKMVVGKGPQLEE